MEKRITNLEAVVDAHKYIILVLTMLTLVNFGFSLWYLQQKTKPDWDFIAVTLTIFEILLAILVAGGYWLFRQHVEKAATDEAGRIAESISAKIATDEANRIATDVSLKVAREMSVFFLREFLPAFTGNGGSDSVQKMMDALGETNDAGGNNGN